MDLRPLPLTERRARLAGLAMPPLVALSPQTDQLALAEQWLAEQTVAGLEGVVVKRADQPYLPGVRGWWKVRAHHTADLIVVGVTGPLRRPIALHLAATDTHTGRLITVGSSSTLNRAARTALAAALVATGPARHRYLSGMPETAEPVLVRPVEPVIAEFLIDTAIDTAYLRHPARFVRLRPDLCPADILLDQLHW